MLKRNVTYETYEDEPQTVTETLYFNLTKAELLELEASEDGGLSGTYQRIMDSGKQNQMVLEVKDLVLKSYGIRSADGRFFRKSKEISDEFYNSAAYATLFSEFAEKEGALEEFIKGIMPKDISAILDLPEAERDAQIKALTTPPVS